MHRQIAGNEAADLLAKKGTTIKQTTNPKLSLQNAKIWIKHEVSQICKIRHFKDSEKKS